MRGNSLLAQRPGRGTRLGPFGWTIVLLAFGLLVWASPAMSQSEPRSAAVDRDEDARIAYTVKRGDTLIGLARRYFRDPHSWRQVQRLNRVRQPNRMAIGRTIVIPVRLLKSAPVRLTIDSFTGPVSVGGTDAALGMEVAEGALVATGARGFVTLAANGGDTVSLPSSSAMRLVRARRYLIDDRLDVLFAMARGRATFSPTPKREGDAWRVRTPVAVTAVRGTTFRVFHEGDSSDATSGTEVVEGTVQLASGGEDRGLDEGFGNVATMAGLLPRERLLRAPELREPGRIQTGEQVSFAIQPVDGARAYRVQLARDAGFLDVVAEQVVEEAQAAFSTLPNGTYFVRARAVAQSGLEGLAETYSFRRQRVGVAASVETDPLAGGFKFAWRPQGDDAALYDFRLWREGKEDRPLVSEVGMRRRELVVGDLPAGVYFWQVTAVRVEPDGLIEAPAQKQKLTVSK